MTSIQKLCQKLGYDCTVCFVDTHSDDRVLVYWTDDTWSEMRYFNGDWQDSFQRHPRRDDHKPVSQINKILTISKDLGTTLRNYMDAYGLRQVNISRLTGIAQPIISRILRGQEPTFPTMRKLAAGLNVDIRVCGWGAIAFLPVTK